MTWRGHASSNGEEVEGREMFEEPSGQPDMVQLALSILAQEMTRWERPAPHLWTGEPSEQPFEDQ
jgi:hypothetical protein